MTGQTISHYRITEKLGEGGMGVVYKATDTRLDRTVALKFLAPHALEDPESKTRFLREARTAASLDHPNICGVYEIGETDGQPFFSMAFIEGQTVRDKVRERPLPLDEALDIAIQAGEGLAVAHIKGVIHRDVKSANLMVTPEGQVKVMDFGLAKAVGGSQVTKTGTTLGTVAYMSPEQAQRRPLDARSDIWSLGVVIYEMMTGRLPFEGEDDQPVMFSIITEEHEPVTALRVGVPTDLDRILGKALAKNPRERYQHIEDMLVDLRALRAGVLTTSRRTFPVRVDRRQVLWAVAGLMVVVLAVALGLNANRLRDRFFGASGPKIDSIAILPLRNLSGDPEQQYFSDGMTETLYTDLAKISALKVISPRSTGKYEGTGTTIRQIARELDVDAIIQGSAVRTGNQVRITAQLIDAETDENLWADSYARDFKDVLVLQNELARAIARRVQVELSPDEALRLSSARPINGEAYEAYLKGNFELAKLTGPGLDAGLQHYKSALEHDPNFAPAHAGIALVWAGLQQMHYVSPSEGAAKIRESVINALELDSSLAESQYALAVYRTWTEWNWEGADTAFRRATELNPNYPDAHAYYSHYLMIMGRLDEAVTEMERALELDPSNILFQCLYAVVLSNMDRYDEALALCREVLEIAPTDPLMLLLVVEIHHAKGMREEAIAAGMNEIAAKIGDEAAEAFQGTYTKSGYEAAFRSAAEASLEQNASGLPYFVARLYVFAGEKELALDQLEKGFELREPSMPYIGVDALLKPLHDAPRFQDLLRRMNLPQYEAVAGGN